MLQKRKKLLLTSISKIIVIIGIATLIGLPGKINLTDLSVSPLKAQAAETTEIWWPTNNATVKDTQPLKAILQGKSLTDYKMYWKVDGGQPNSMYDSQNDYPHKEAMVDVTSWAWKGAGPYTITFVSKDNSGNEISQKSVQIYTSDIAKMTTVTTSSGTTSSVASSTTSANNTTIATTSNTTPSTSSATQPTTVVMSSIEVWWPTDSAYVSGVQPLKAIVKDRSIEHYLMYWKVDNGSLNSMGNNYVGYPHKETTIDLRSWTWKGVGPYTITFVAKDKSNNIIATKSIKIYNSAVTTAIQSTQTAGTTTTQVTTVTPTTSTLGKSLYVDPNNPAKRQANEWRNSRPYEAGLMDKIGNQSAAMWIGNWNSNVENDVRNIVTNASTQNAIPVIVAYNITNRDCGSYSAGGAGSADGYKSWIRSVARGIGDKSAIIILEPDAVAGWDCLSTWSRDERAQLLADAVTVLKAQPNVKVYIDGGNPTWITASEMANRLNRVNINRADGFSLNVSNYYTTEANTTYGQTLSSKLNGKHFIIDTSRNGNGSNGEWCNPLGRALGNKPTLNTGNSLIDGYLWLKVPGESDGTCNGGPGAGQWWADYAVGLAARASW